MSRGTVSYDATQSSTPTNEAFETLFSEGDYSFSMDAADGFQITFMDDDGVEWSSSTAEALANSNWFTIYESVSGERLGSFYTAVRGGFSCGVTNSNGDIKGCSGEFVFSFVNQ